MSYIPPFSISADILNLVADISEKVGQLNASALNVSPQLRKQNAPVNIAGLKTSEAIILLLQHNPQLTRQQLAEVMGKDIRTIGRAISKLQQANQLKRIGSDKTGYWEVQL
ncbi:winged helix-turn-helix transcriptional regulator [Cysteiniphilum sp. JM-1]|uniref:winged helix-turn-helix transcriptional regulator n=1 Tax=Cysteiniphilum sp. JM-1 TaxID=2610891 RepID=UPI0012449FBD|nr:winged helix-turn-helix transcriptional regulator [Cysteiniphilum sp. JM-1]